VSYRHSIAKICGIIAYYFVPVRKKVVLNNLRIAFPTSPQKWRKDIARRCYIHFAKVFIDFFPIYKVSDEKFRQYVDIGNIDALKEVLKRGRGAIIVLFHLGNWEVFSECLVRNCFSIGAIVMKLKNPLTNTIITETRLRKGGQIFSMREPSTRMIKFLNGENILITVADQDARNRGIFVRFFGRLTSTFRGPALFAIRKKCPLMVGTCLSDKRGKYIIQMKEIPTYSDKSLEQSPVEYITQLYTNYFEELIRDYPEQYFWFHRRWKTKPPIEVEKNLPCPE
jgi:KDO2-lipid IV(A) lauroyltransferase